MKITRCLHTAVLVSNVEKAEYFYSQILGLSKVDRILKYPGIWYQIGDYQIHLIESPGFTPSRENEGKWGRNPHIALEVTDLNEAIAQLTSHNYPMQMSASGRPALFVSDPDGNILEISQVSL